MSDINYNTPIGLMDFDQRIKMLLTKIFNLLKYLYGYRYVYRYKKEATKIKKQIKFLDGKGLDCPISIIKGKKALSEMESDQALEIHATERKQK